jgi:YD repeat-containing protein
LNGNAVIRSVSSPGGNTTVFHYQYVTNLSWLAPLGGVTRPMGNAPYTQTVAGVTLDGRWTVARVTSQYDAYSNAVAIAYDGSTNRVTETRPDGTVVAYCHSREKGPPVSVTDSKGCPAYFSATADEQIAAMDDREGGRTTFEWQEDSGLLTAITNAAGGVFRRAYSPETTVFTNPPGGELVTNVFLRSGSNRLSGWNLVWSSRMTRAGVRSGCRIRPDTAGPFPIIRRAWLRSSSIRREAIFAMPILRTWFVPDGSIPIPAPCRTGTMRRFG